MARNVELIHEVHMAYWNSAPVVERWNRAWKKARELQKNSVSAGISDAEMLEMQNVLYSSHAETPDEAGG